MNHLLTAHDAEQLAIVVAGGLALLTCTWWHGYLCRGTRARRDQRRAALLAAWQLGHELGYQQHQEDIDRLIHLGRAPQSRGIGPVLPPSPSPSARGAVDEAERVLRAARRPRGDERWQR